MKRWAESDSDAAHASHFPGWMQYTIESLDADRDHRYAEPRCDHSHAGLKRGDLAIARHLAFGKNEHTPFFVRHLAHIAKRFERARLVLRNGEGVEEPCRQVIVQAVAETSSVEMRLEEFFAHGWGNAVAPARGKSGEDGGHVHVALVIGREDHRRR